MGRGVDGWMDFKLDGNKGLGWDWKGFGFEREIGRGLVEAGCARSLMFRATALAMLSDGFFFTAS